MVSSRGGDRELYMEEYRLDPAVCPCIGQSLKEARLRSQSGALVLAIWRVDGSLIGGPTAETILMAGDLLICMGTEQLRQINQILGPIGYRVPRPPKQGNH